MHSLSTLALMMLGSVAATGTGSDAIPAPYSIYDRARDVLAAERYPDRFQYGVTVGVVEGGAAHSAHYRCESVDGDVRPLGVSDAEREAPHEVSGVDLRLTLTLGWKTHQGGPSNSWSASGNRKESLPDFLGVPLISPAYMFGMNAAAQVAEPPSAMDAGSLHSIATVVSENRIYAISLAGEESLRGVLAYHLQLRPLRSPALYRLRELWIDAKSYDVLQADLQGNFINAPMSQVPWTVEFETVDGITYISSESTSAALRFRRDRTFDGARITFDEIGDATGTLPVLPDAIAQDALREP